MFFRDFEKQQQQQQQQNQKTSLFRPPVTPYSIRVAQPMRFEHLH